MFSLKDKVALVTGASQGIGRDTARALAEAGAKVAVAARNEQKLAVLVKDIVTAGGEAFSGKMDVADAEHGKAGFKQGIWKFGRLGHLVKNAPTTPHGLALRLTPEQLEGVVGDGDSVGGYGFGERWSRRDGFFSQRRGLLHHRTCSRCKRGNVSGVRRLLNVTHS